MNSKLSVWEKLSFEINKFWGTANGTYFGFTIISIWALSYLLQPCWHTDILELVAMLSFFNMFTTQRGQTKELKALHIKLDELIASSEVANNLLIKAEEAPEHVLNQMHEVYQELARNVEEGSDNRVSAIAEADRLLEAITQSTAD